MISLAKILPREDKFYVLLERLAEQSSISARQLKLFVEQPPGAARNAAGDAVSASKDEAKKIFGEVTKELCFSFITPFDREDIQDFAANLYKITKMIEKVHERLMLHEIFSDRGDFSRQTDLIAQEAVAMESMVKALIRSRDTAEIVKKANELQELEQRGDEILSELLVSLFKENREARDLILRKDVYDMLEKVVDRYRDAAGVALQIVLKHS